mmetsp:Transcript_35258/g.90634  ORF Transcript_35258/g.90634 Transcript_35258/m.90634 type:complete len:219 (-) Transcript_35258:110-766(-)
MKHCSRQVVQGPLAPGRQPPFSSQKKPPWAPLCFQSTGQGAWSLHKGILPLAPPLPEMISKMPAMIEAAAANSSNPALQCHDLAMPPIACRTWRTSIDVSSSLMSSRDDASRLGNSGTPPPLVRPKDFFQSFIQLPASTSPAAGSELLLLRSPWPPRPSRDALPPPASGLAKFELPRIVWKGLGVCCVVVGNAAIVCGSCQPFWLLKAWVLKCPAGLV